jgi:hypothetical protein
MYYTSSVVSVMLDCSGEERVWELLEEVLEQGSSALFVLVLHRDTSAIVILVEKRKNIVDNMQ